MAIDDPLHQAEAKAGAARWRRTRRIGLIEPLEHVRGDVRRHPDAGVSTSSRARSPSRDTRTTTHPPSRRELHRVVEQIEDEPFQPARITERRRRRRHRSRSADRAARCATGSSCSTSEPPARRDRRRRTTTESDPTPRAPASARGRSAASADRSLRSGSPATAAARSSRAGAQRQLDLAAQSRQRRAQLVRERRAELSHLADRPSSRPSVSLKAQRHLFEFVVRRHAVGRRRLKRGDIDVARGDGQRASAEPSAKPDSHQPPAAASTSESGARHSSRSR